MGTIKRVGAIPLAAALLLAVLILPAAALETVDLTIDGVPVLYDEDYGFPFLDEAGRTQVPFRRTLETFGCTVDWENDSRTAVAWKDGTTVRVPIGESEILVNGERVPIDTVSVILNGRTYLPVRAVLEAFGAHVQWDNALRQVVVSTGESLTRVHFIDVGQGDAALIDCGETEVLIDGGDNQAGPLVAEYLRPYVDGKLDYVIATHPDADHIGGLDDVLAAYQVGEVIDSGKSSDSLSWQDYWDAVLTEEDCLLSYDEDRMIPLGSETQLFLIETGDDWLDPNDCSVVAQLICGNVTVLFTGDMTQTAEWANLDRFGPVDVLKTGHHGSASSTSREFLSVVRPDYAVISYQTGNSYHHPSEAALSRLLDWGTTVLGTGKSGAIVLTTDGEQYSFNTENVLTMEDAGA